MIDYVSLEKYAKDVSILFVEDDIGISKGMKLLLSELFSDIKIAFDGKEAIEEYHGYYKENNRYPDLIITDIQMPNMNGIELIKYIYKINPNQKIIVLSAYNESIYLMELINLGIYRFILKPINHDNFFEIIFKISKEIYVEKHKNTEEKENIFLKLADDLIWNKELKQLYFNNKLFKLTKKEFLLIELLTKTNEKIFVNEEILAYVWELGIDNPDISNLKNLISRIRNKLPSLRIENIYGFGYKIVTI